MPNVLAESNIRDRIWYEYLEPYSSNTTVQVTILPADDLAANVERASADKILTLYPEYSKVSTTRVT